MTTRAVNALSPNADAERYDGVNGCCAEGYFREMLVFERRRSERSGRPCLVMTLDFSGIGNPEDRREALRLAADGLLLLTRTTDIKGWYRKAAVLGVILTEMNSLDTNAIQEKMSKGLKPRLSEAQWNALRISFHRFPDDGGPAKPTDPSQFTFYPDSFRQKRSGENGRVKRVVDIVGSIAGMLIFTPFFLLIPIAIKLSSRGPVLFRQERVGLRGKKFTFLKFRSMYVDNDPGVHREFVLNFISGNPPEGGNEAGEKIYKITKDRRITPFGHLLRKTSLDELPQFFNVLRGDMSLVGPRPPIPYELEKYESWHRRRVLEVKPGITGLWQVMGRSSTTFDEMVRLDLRYAASWSLWLDFSILLRTPWAVVGGKGAY